MVNNRRGAPTAEEAEDQPEIPNLETLVAHAINNMLPGLNAAEVVARLVNDLRNGAGSSGGSGGSGGGRPTTIAGWLDKFSKHKPLSFSVATKPQDAEDWIAHMEKLFEVLGCEDEFKTRLATFKLEGDALNWWKAHRLAQGENNNPAIYTWTEFRDVFYKRYFPPAEQERFEREYSNIYQFEHENSGEYMRRFVRLASFVGPIAGDARRQAKHFKWGLKKWVLESLLNIEFNDVSSVNDAARNIEIFREGSGYKRSRDGERIQHRAPDSGRGFSGRNHDMDRGRSDQVSEYRGRSDRSYDQRGQIDRSRDSRPTTRSGNDRSGNGNGNSYGKGNKNNNNRQWRDQSTRGTQPNRSSGSSGQHRPTEVLPPPPMCPTCNKPHPGPCRKLTGECYRCGSTTHRVKDCPKANPTASASVPRLPAPSGRVFTTTRDQAAGTSGTITGILNFGDITAFVLFDTGATHSIISSTFAKKLELTPTPLTNQISISTPMKDRIMINHEFINCPIRFPDRIHPANLLPLNMIDFDIILGMDWLASHKATIDCHARNVIFGNLNSPEYVYHGSQPLKSVKLISALKARTLISHGCQGFLASVKDTSAESPDINNIPVV